MAPSPSQPAHSALPSLSKDKELYFHFLPAPLSTSVSTKYISNTTVSAKKYVRNVFTLKKEKKININSVIKYCTYSVASSDNYLYTDVMGTSFNVYFTSSKGKIQSSLLNSSIPLEPSNIKINNSHYILK